MALPRHVGIGRALLNRVNDLTPFIFNSALATFTAGIAKRLPYSGPFASGLIVQGPITPAVNKGDIISYPMGTALLSEPLYSNVKFYPTHDLEQGSISCFVTPEWAGNDGKDHSILAWQTIWAQIAKDSSNNLTFALNIANTVSVSAAAWTAGTAYHVVTRWDFKNTIDGTNYMCISVNDTHTYGRTTTPSIGTPGTTITIGGTQGTENGRYSFNGSISGLTVYRRVLSDGVNGNNAGNGDEIARIYNGGTFVDPIEITGSQDVVFAAPTNGTVGELVTGVGEAWSSPWTSNVPSITNMTANGYYGGGQAVVLNGTSAYISCGSESGLDNVADNILCVDGWFRASDVNTSNIIRKGVANTSGWEVLNVNSQLYARVICATTHPSVAGAYIFDQKWHHFCYLFNDGGDRKGYLACDGVWTTGGTASGAIVADAAYDVVIGASNGKNSNFLTGAVGWMRISNVARWTAGTNFIPPRTPPATDANTLAQWNMGEGTGTTVDNAEGTATRDGTITDGTWERQWKDYGSPLANDTAAVFNGTSAYIDCGSDASIDDLHDNDITVEGWFKLGSATQTLIGKSDATNGWRLNASTTALQGNVYCATTSAAASYTTSTIRDGRWHHYAMTYSDAGDRKIYLYLDGVLVNTSAAGVGAIKTDASLKFLVGARSDGSAGWMVGAAGWCRVSNNIRYTTNFIPAPRTSPPAADGNTIVQYNMTEGAGATATIANTGSGTATGTGVALTWSNSRSLDQCVGNKIFIGGIQTGNDAADEGVVLPLTGLTAGQNYVCLPVISGESNDSQPALTILDDTNTDTILDWHGPDQTLELVTNGTFDSDVSGWTGSIGSSVSGGVSGNCLQLSRGGSDYARMEQPIQLVPYAKYSINFFFKKVTISGSLYIQSPVGGTGVYDSGVMTNTANFVEKNGTFVTSANGMVNICTAINTGSTSDTCLFDSISIKRILPNTAPLSSFCTFELPTNARDGVGADCTAISIAVTNVKSTGVVHLQQLQLLPNLVDDPSMEKNVANGVDVGTPTTSERSNTKYHVAGYSWKITADAAHEGRSFTVNTTSGKFYAAMVQVYVDTSGTVDFDGPTFQSKVSGGGPRISAAVNTWEKLMFVFRATDSTSTVKVVKNETGTFYIDDLAIFELTDVALTVTPPNVTNSAEGTGIRVDGKDTLTQGVL
jgi:hypothetical protein